MLFLPLTSRFVPLTSRFRSHPNNLSPSAMCPDLSTSEIAELDLFFFCSSAGGNALLLREWPEGGE